MQSLAALFQHKKSELFISLGALFSTVALISMSALMWGLGTIHNDLDENIESHLNKMRLVVDMRNAALARTQCLSNMLILDDPFEKDEIFLDFNRYGAEFAAARQKLLEKNLSPVEKVILVNQGEFSGKAVPIQNEIVDLIQRGEEAQANFKLIRQAIPWQNLVMDKLTELYTYQENATQVAIENSQQTYENARRWMIVAAIIAGVIGVLVALIIVRRNIKSIKDRELHLEQLANTNEKLELAIKEAKKANESKSIFLANMSHELRTPLNAILGYCEIIKGELHLTDLVASKKDCNNILHSAKHLLSLINEILDLSKIEAGKMKVYVEQVQCSDLIDSISATIKPLAELNGNRFSINFDAELPELVSDFMKVKQILINLLGNACKFTENGIISLNIGSKVLNGQTWFSFIVQDNGPGITPDELGKVFDPFEQANRSVSNRKQGTGLGLAVTKRLSELLEGEIDIYSEIGQGTTCIVKLPNLSSRLEKQNRAA